MISAMKNRLLLAATLLLGLPPAFAQAPSGAIGFTFDRTTIPIWDFTGAYQFNQQMVSSGGSMALSFPLSINHDLAGGLSGSGTTLVTIGPESDAASPTVLAAQYEVEGAVSLSGNATRVSFTVSLSGSGLDVIAGEPHAYHISLTYDLVVDSDLLAWVPPAHGKAVSGSVSIAGVGSAAVIPGDGFTVALPSGVDGAWGVSMDILALSRLAGTATILVDGSAAPDRPAYQSGTLTLNASLAGTYRPSLGSRLELSGMPGSSPAALQLALDSDAQLVRVTGRILGQTINFSY
jgi:hypothetical protein